MTNPTPRSLAAQAVLDAYNDATSRVAPDMAVIAAALRAASFYLTNVKATDTLRAIADELEGLKVS